MNKSLTVLILMLGLVVSVGCAKSDWIQQTLVTADVTGRWKSPESLFDIRLEQQGSKVTGFILSAGTGGTQNEGPLEGTVAGDVFRFKQTAARYGAFEGELTVNGDEMNGQMRSLWGFRGHVLLRRIDSSPPRSQ